MSKDKETALKLRLSGNCLRGHVRDFKNVFTLEQKMRKARAQAKREIKKINQNYQGTSSAETQQASGSEKRNRSNLPY